MLVRMCLNVGVRVCVPGYAYTCVSVSVWYFELVIWKSNGSKILDVIYTIGFLGPVHMLQLSQDLVTLNYSEACK